MRAYADAENWWLEDYALFRAIHAGNDARHWTEWDPPLRDRDPAALTETRRTLDHEILYYTWLQWIAGTQWAHARAAVHGLELLGDFPFMVSGDSADVWARQEEFRVDASVGVPPDAFSETGQDWGLPPFIPWKLRDAGYEPLARLWRGALSAGGGGLRIDHVMGLFRLFWIPPSATAAEGAYVRYRGDELLAVLAVESVRAGAVIVGEDLGTVEPAVRHDLYEAGVLSYRLVWFEDEPPEQYPHQALAAVTTHDLPTVAGVWSGSDDEDQRAAGVEPDPLASDDMRFRLRDVSGLGPHAAVNDVIVSAHRRLARSPSMLVAATLEDALAVEARTNLPGTTSERPNWSHALPLPLEKALRHPLLLRLARAIRR